MKPVKQRNAERLHKARVRTIKANKGKYWRVEFRSARHAAQIIAAAKCAGFKLAEPLCLEDDYTITFYEHAKCGVYNHACDIHKPTFIV